MTRSILNIETSKTTVSDNVLLSGLNVTGCDQANLIEMYGTVLEPFLDGRKADKDKGIDGIPAGRAILIGDDNSIAGLEMANPANPNGRGYAVVTLGVGNMGAEVQSDDGDLIAQIAMETDATVTINLGACERIDVRQFLHDFARHMSVVEKQSQPLLIGYVKQHQHFLRQHVGATKTTRETQFMTGRLRGLNIRLMNGVRAIQDLPVEFNMSSTNTIAMVQSNPAARVQLANHVGRAFTRRILTEAMTPDCGLAFSGVNHGTYFNFSDLDPAAPYVIETVALRSGLGTAPDPKRKINKATREFMKKLQAARTERTEIKERKEAAKLVAQVQDAERKRLVRLEAKRTMAATMAADGGKNAIAPSVRKLVRADRPGKASRGMGMKKHFIAAGVPNAINAATMMMSMAAYEDVTGVAIPTSSASEMAEMAKTVEMAGLLAKARSTADKSGIYMYGAWAIVHLELARIDETKAGVFMGQVNARADRKSCASALWRRLNGLTPAERTTRRVIDYAFQAWSAFAAGRSVEEFTDSETLSTSHAQIVPFATRNVASLRSAA